MTWSSGQADGPFAAGRRGEFRLAEGGHPVKPGGIYVIEDLASAYWPG